MHGSGPRHGQGLEALRAAVLEVLGSIDSLAAPGGPTPALAGAGPAGAPPALRHRADRPLSDSRLYSAEDTRLLRPPLASRARSGSVAAAATETANADIVAAVARAQQGSAEAFGELYDAYVDTVYRYVCYRVGTPALAEDLTSETFLRALRRITSFSWQGKDFSAWLVTIARNLVADHFKSGRFRLEVATADMVDADRAENGPEDAVVSALTGEVLIDAVKKLSPDQQECIVLRFLQGMSVAETAAIMGKNGGAVKTLQYRAVRALAQLVPVDVR